MIFLFKKQNEIANISVFFFICFSTLFFPNKLFASNVKTAEFSMLKIAIVDIQSVLEASTAIQSIKKNVDNISRKIQKDILEKDNKFKIIENQLIQKRSELKKEEFETEVYNFNKKVSLVKQQIEKRKTRLEECHSKAVAKVQDTITNIISDTAIQYNIDIVLSNTLVFFSKDTLNITNEIIEILNKKLSYIEVNYE